MLRGIGTTSSVIHVAGAPAGGTSASPKTLVVLAKTNAATPATADSSSRLQAG
jgi:hypothetical protein